MSSPLTDISGNHLVDQIGDDLVVSDSSYDLVCAPGSYTLSGTATTLTYTQATGFKVHFRRVKK